MSESRKSRPAVSLPGEVRLGAEGEPTPAWEAVWDGDPEAGDVSAETSDDDGPTEATIPTTDGPALVDLMRMSEDEWDAYTRGSAMRRAGYAGLRRNVAIAIGNWLAESDRPTRRPWVSWWRRCRTRIRWWRRRRPGRWGGWGAGAREPIRTNPAHLEARGDTSRQPDRLPTPFAGSLLDPPVQLSSREPSWPPDRLPAR